MEGKMDNGGVGLKSGGMDLCQNNQIDYNRMSINGRNTTMQNLGSISQLKGNSHLLEKIKNRVFMQEFISRTPEFSKHR